MRQASLKLKMYVGSTNIVHDTGLQRRVLQAMLAGFGVLALSYIIILGNMVFNIVERKVLEKEIASLSNEVGGLELTYLSLSSKVDLKLSETMGFKEAKPAFAIRKSLGLNISNPNAVDNEI